MTVHILNPETLDAHQLAEGADLPGQQRRPPGGVGAVPQLMGQSRPEVVLPPLPRLPRPICFQLRRRPPPARPQPRPRRLERLVAEDLEFWGWRLGTRSLERLVMGPYMR